MKAQRQREIRQPDLLMLPPYFGNREIQIVRKHSDDVQKFQMTLQVIGNWIVV